ncbi:amidohydrolase family protein [Roseomonas marmotae]|uniref:adenosine deaminase n=1 Tax=Roseomonas marmotae TaxID=2768161 RepID=A0ABS3KDY3_9PROT|nr:hypothetical protein [Roseomonas marmotae]MBO1075688.1 hypothetical protein [Roseomonas marmotae]QTI79544.1 hypothetical protein IAI58_01595 [Roseomonas marmotae]
MEQFTSLSPATALKTDIHTHLTGAPRSAELIRLGLLHDLPYPAAMLRLAGIPLPDGIRLVEEDTRILPGGIAAPARGSPMIPLRSLPPRSLALLEAAMEMPRRPADGSGPDPFLLLERAYSVRRPLGAHPALLAGILESVAADARQDGVRHIELSASAPLTEDGEAWMQAAERAARATLASQGVRILFLATVNRHAPPEAITRALARLDEMMAGHPLLAGLDIAGHETNPTGDFMPAVAAWAATRVRQGLPAIVRVHAGETPCHPGNVRMALEGFREAGLPPGMGRIGHALYGVGRREVALAREIGAVVEMGIGSNRALGYRSGPGRSGGGGRLARLISAGVPTVLGTDGHGIYGTSPAREAVRALRDGASAAVMAEVARHEADHLRRVAAAFPAVA